jgi:hypothetical protein
MITFKEELLGIDSFKESLLTTISIDKTLNIKKYNDINEFELEVLLSIEDHREMVSKLYDKINKIKYIENEEIIYIIEQVSKVMYNDYNYLNFLFYLSINMIEVDIIYTKYNKYDFTHKYNKKYSPIYDFYTLFNNKDIKLLKYHSFMYNIQEKISKYKNIKELNTNITNFINNNYYYKYKDNYIVIDNKDIKNEKLVLKFKN